MQDYIALNIDGDLSLDALSKIACFSKFHFHRVFKSITGETVQHYVKRVKLDRAAALLADRAEESTLTAIAYRLGFPDAAAFSRIFREYYGIAPSEYRRLCRKTGAERIEIFTLHAVNTMKTSGYPLGSHHQVFATAA